MKKAFLAACVFLLVAASGCTQPLTPEQKAVALADNVPQVRAMLKLVESLANVEKCTPEKLYAAYQTASALNGQQAPPLTEGQKQQMQDGITQAVQFSKKCAPRVEKSVAKESESVYAVKYSLLTSGESDCGTAAQGITIKADIEKGTTELLGMEGFDAQTAQKLELALTAFGECTPLMMSSMAGAQINPGADYPPDEKQGAAQGAAG